MFASLTNALTPQVKKPKIVNNTPKVACTAPNTDENLPPDLADMNFNLPNFELQPIYDFETIDDDLLVQLVNEVEDPTRKTYQNQTDNKTVVPVTTGQTVTNNTQVINQTMPNMPIMPRLPAMYFPHSNVTINYNFNK